MLKEQFLNNLYSKIDRLNIPDLNKEQRKSNLAKKYEFLFDNSKEIEEEIKKKNLKGEVPLEERILEWQRWYEENPPESKEEMWKQIPTIDERGPYGYTRLIIACLDSNLQDIKDLIAKGADPKVRSNSGLTAFELSILEEKYESVRVLEELGIKS